MYFRLGINILTSTDNFKPFPKGALKTHPLRLLELRFLKTFEKIFVTDKDGTEIFDLIVP